MSQCIDPIVGKILAGWRYDISGLAPEMRGDYEEHFAACERCRSKQRLHRTIDVSLIALASVSAGLFLLAFRVTRLFGPQPASILELATQAWLALSALTLLGFAVVVCACTFQYSICRDGSGSDSAGWQSDCFCIRHQSSGRDLHVWGSARQPSAAHLIAFFRRFLCSGKACRGVAKSCILTWE